MNRLQKALLVGAVALHFVPMGSVALAADRCTIPPGQSYCVVPAVTGTPRTAEARKLHQAQCDYKAGKITATEYRAQTRGLHADESDPNNYAC